MYQDLQCGWYQALGGFLIDYRGVCARDSAFIIEIWGGLFQKSTVPLACYACGKRQGAAGVW